MVFNLIFYSKTYIFRTNLILPEWRSMEFEFAPDFDHLGFFGETLAEGISRLQKGSFRLYIPPPIGKMRRIAGTHFHFSPELFMQVNGITDFIFPEGKIRLRAGEVLLMPRGVPHGETAKDAEKAFLNVVVMFPPDSVSIHDAVRDRNGRPHCFYQEYFETEKGRRIEQYLDDVADLHHAGPIAPRSGNRHVYAPAKAEQDFVAAERAGRPLLHSDIDLAVQGLLQAALAGLLMIVREIKTPARATEHVKVGECRKYILSHLYESSLSVRGLAGQVHCSADYLSHLFVTETGERLCDFIHKERIGLAKRYLKERKLSVKETAWSCGFRDQGYFTRLFKRLTGKTPKAFRKRNKPDQ